MVESMCHPRLSGVVYQPYCQRARRQAGRQACVKLLTLPAEAHAPAKHGLPHRACLLAA